MLVGDAEFKVQPVILMDTELNVQSVIGTSDRRREFDLKPGDDDIKV